MRHGRHAAATTGNGPNDGAGMRASALWGRGSKGAAALAAVVSVLLISISAPAAGADSSKPAAVPADLLAQAQANPDQVFHVIVEGSSSDAAAQGVAAKHGKLKQKFRSLSGVAADLSG